MSRKNERLWLIGWGLNTMNWIPSFEEGEPTIVMETWVHISIPSAGQYWSRIVFQFRRLSATWVSSFFCYCIYLRLTHTPSYCRVSSFGTTRLEMARRERENGKLEDTKLLAKNVSSARSFVNPSSQRPDSFVVLCQYPLSYCSIT